MKNFKPQVTIANPCTQNWEEMEKKEGFNFCQSCQKMVTDFTSYSNAEIIKTLAIASSEICGRLTKNQLDQLNYHLVVAPANRNWMKYLGVLAIGVSIFTQNVSAAIPQAKTEVSVNMDRRDDDMKPATIKRITGKVLDAHKKPLEGIRIVISNTKYYATTDKDGRYEIKFVNGIDVKNKVLSVQSLRFVASMPINFSIQKQQDLLLKDQEAIIMGGMGYSPMKKSDSIIKS